MLNIIKEQLLSIVDDIDAGNSNATEEEQIKIVKTLRDLTRKDTGISKYQAYTYLGIKRAKFDNLVREGKIPKGKKIQGFKELRWFKKDLLKYNSTKEKHA